MGAPSSKLAYSRGSPTGSRWREVAGILLLALGIFLALSLLSADLSDGRLMGPLGRALAHQVVDVLGFGAYFVALILAIVPVRLLAGRGPLKHPVEACG